MSFCWSRKKYGNFRLVSARLSVERHPPSTHFFQSSFRAGFFFVGSVKMDEKRENARKNKSKEAKERNRERNIFNWFGRLSKWNDLGGLGDGSGGWFRGLAQVRIFFYTFLVGNQSDEMYRTGYMTWKQVCWRLLPTPRYPLTTPHLSLSLFLSLNIYIYICMPPYWRVKVNFL